MEMTQKSNSSLTSSGKVLLPGRVTLIARLNAKFAHAKAKAIIQKCVRELENKRWLRKVMEDSGDSKGFFDSTEVVYGLSYHCMTPLHSKYELMLLKDNALIKKKKVEGALWGPRMPELQVLHQLHQISSATFMYCYWKYGIRRKSQQNVGMPSLSPYLRKGTEQTVAFPSCPQLGTFWLGSWLTDSSPYQRKFFQNLRVDFALIGEP